jgi:hypothetical protein
MFTLYTTFGIVILTSLWAGVDSHRLKVPASNKPYTLGNGSLSWLFCCLLLWIIAFPAYLFKRAKTLKERGMGSGSTSLLGTFAIVAVVLCVASPFLGWERLSVDELREQVGASIQGTWKSDPASQNYRLKSITLVHRAGNEYTGGIVVNVSGSEEQHSIDVTYDGKSFSWQIK